MEQITNWIDYAYKSIIGVAVLWGGWKFTKSKAMHKADDDNSTASSIKEWAEAFKLVTTPLNDEIQHVRSEFKTVQDKIIELSIQVGVLTRENDRIKDENTSLRRENSELKDRIKQLEAA